LAVFSAVLPWYLSQTEAAAALGISREAVRQLCDKYGFRLRRNPGATAGSIEDMLTEIGELRREYARLLAEVDERIKR
jgi:predicted transcriptional regulator